MLLRWEVRTQVLFRPHRSVDWPVSAGFQRVASTGRMLLVARSGDRLEDAWLRDI